MAKVLPEYLSKWTTAKVRSEGVDVLPNTFVKSASITQEDKVQLDLNNGESIQVDHIVSAVGIDPNVELARSSGLCRCQEGSTVGETRADRTDILVGRLKPTY